MVKIIAFSDSHGNKNLVDKVFANSYDYYFFLGDGIDDLGIYSLLDNVKIVKGNCDYNHINNVDYSIEIEKYKFFLTHGHSYNVKSGIGNLITNAKNIGADFVLYGHTHCFGVQNVDNCTYINVPNLNKNGDNLAFCVEITINEKKVDIICKKF